LGCIYKMKLNLITLVVLVAFVFGGLGFCACYWWHGWDMNERYQPSDLLGFPPVMKGSDETAVKTAQAELCRHGIDCKVDGDCGKQTALGICELLCRFEDEK
jgi:hypothetical protein